MAMPQQPWRTRMVTPSFRGAAFRLEVAGLGTGRRNTEKEYPKRDTPFGEDMGRRARSWPITGYVVGPTYFEARDALIAACEAEGPGTLVHPTLGEVQAICDRCNMTETKERGGIATFEMLFLEAGQDPDETSTEDTQSTVKSAADTSDAAAANSLNQSLGGSSGIGSDTVASMRAANAATQDSSLGVSSSTSGLA